MGKTLPPIPRFQQREKRKTLPGNLSAYQSKQSKTKKDKTETDERLRLLHSRNKAYIQ